MSMHTWETQPHDLNILRTLAERKAEIAEEEANKERRRLWYALDEGTSERPMVLAESWVSFEDLPDATLHCRAEWARKLEHDLRFEIFVFERIRDDHVVEPFINLNWDVTCSNFGVEVRTEWAGRVSGNVSSRRWEPPIKNIDRDSHLLRARNYTVDRKKTLAWKAHLDEVFKGILPTRIRGGFWWTMGMTAHAIELIGLENYMLYTCTDPEGLHRLMAFLRDDHLAYADWLEQEGLLSLNNENDYIGSGSMGYTHALPQDGNGGTSAVRLQDLWVLVESQESVGLSPDMLQEFVFPYHKTLAEQFGRTYYGCCEPVHLCWNTIKRLPNLARVSISPWCDEEAMAGILGRDYVFSRKPHPARISSPDFDEDAIRRELRHTLSVAGECNLEIIMKDVHTLCGEPQRMARWVEIARQEIDRFSS